MCRFRSGLIFKNRVVVAQGSDDSHTNLLEELQIEDSIQNAMTKFVRVELVPPNDEWWTNPDTWEANVDQDILPEWFENDREKYIENFRHAVKEWWEEHVLVDKKIDELTIGYYRLKRCEVKRTLKDVQLMLDDSTVQEMLDDSTVQDMFGNSTVQEMWDNSTVQKMWDNSTVQEMLGNSTVQKMLGNSTVQKMFGNSTVQKMLDDSIARDNAHGVIRISSETRLNKVVHENREVPNE